MGINNLKRLSFKSDNFDISTITGSTEVEQIENNFFTLELQRTRKKEEFENFNFFDNLSVNEDSKVKKIKKRYRRQKKTSKEV